MPTEVFEKIAEEVKTVTDTVCLHVLGEPLSHPEIERIFDLCQAHQLRINLVTNGLLLERHKPLLQHPALNELHVSLQSFSDNFKASSRTYLSKLKNIIAASQASRPLLKVFLRLWDQGSDHQQAAENTQSLKFELAEVFEFQWDNVFFDLKRKKLHYVQTHLALYFDSRFEWPSIEQPMRFATGTCHALKHHIGILVDGSVVPCCLDSKGAIVLGKLPEERLTQILAKPRATAMRQGFEQGQLCESLCQRCDFAQRFSSRR
jgi:hypothetical protein